MAVIESDPLFWSSFLCSGRWIQISVCRMKVPVTSTCWTAPHCHTSSSSRGTDDTFLPSVTMETTHTAQQHPGNKITLGSVNLQICFLIKHLVHKKSGNSKRKQQHNIHQNCRTASGSATTDPLIDYLSIIKLNANYFWWIGVNIFFSLKNHRLASSLLNDRNCSVFIILKYLT